MRLPWTKITAQDVAGPFELAHLQLAAALCSLPFVPFSMLRAIRQFVCPEVSESRFCASNLVDGMSADGISLDLSVCEPLRHRVRSLYCDVASASDQPAIEVLRELLDAHSHSLSPLLVMEEQLLWAWLTKVNETELRATCDIHIRDILGTAIFEDRPKIYRWASAASERLPIQCFDSELGWVLGQLCRTRKIHFPTIDLSVDGFRDRTLLDALATGLPDRLLGLHRDGEYLEIGPVTARRHVAVPVVDTDPIAIDVAATQHNREATLWLRLARAIRIPVGRETVTIRDLRGRTYSLPGFIGDDAPEATEARKALESAIAYQASAAFVRFEVLRRGKSGYVVSLPDLGCTAYLAEPAAAFGPGDHGVAAVVDVIAKQRRVIVQLPNHIVADTEPERRLPRAALPSDIPWRFQAQVLKLGKNAGKRGRSVHILLPDGHPLWGLSPDGVGRIRFPYAAYQTPNGWEPKPGSWVDVVVVSQNETHIGLRLDLTNVKPGSLGQVHHIEEPTTPAKRPRRPRRAVPWPDEEPLVVGQHLELRITSIVNFGAFLKLPDGREGLLHVTEMYPKHQRGDIPHRPGDILRVVVASIDAERGRISFTQEPLTE